MSKFLELERFRAKEKRWRREETNRAYLIQRGKNNEPIRREEKRDGEKRFL